MLQGTWDEGQGGTFVRNPQYDPATDDTERAQGAAGQDRVPAGLAD